MFTAKAVFEDGKSLTYECEEMFLPNQLLLNWLARHNVNLRAGRRGTDVLANYDTWARTYDTFDGRVCEVRANPECASPGKTHYSVIFYRRTDNEE